MPPPRPPPPPPCPYRPHAPTASNSVDVLHRHRRPYRPHAPAASNSVDVLHRHRRPYRPHRPHAATASNSVDVLHRHRRPYISAVALHRTSVSCSLGLNGSTNLCISSPGCSICSIVRDGFKPDVLGKIRTMETSGGAHDVAEISSDGDERAMLVCRVIGGRVNKNQDGSELEMTEVFSYSM